MDELLGDEIRAVRESVNRFMEAEVNPVMDDVERRGEFPRDLVKRAGALGLYGAVFPEIRRWYEPRLRCSDRGQRGTGAQRRALCRLQQSARVDLPTVHLHGRYA